MTKAELRKNNLIKQKALSPDERRSASDRIAENFFDELDLRGVWFIHVFIPIEKFNEIDTRPVVERLWRDHPQVQVVVPRVDFEANEMLNLRFGPGTELAKTGGTSMSRPTATRSIPRVLTSSSFPDSRSTFTVIASVTEKASTTGF